MHPSWRTNVWWQYRKSRASIIPPRSTSILFSTFKIPWRGWTNKVSVSVNVFTQSLSNHTIIEQNYLTIILQLYFCFATYYFATLSQQACKLYCKFFFMNLIKIIIVTLLSEGEERKKKEEIRYSNVNYQSWIIIKILLCEISLILNASNLNERGN